MPATGRFRAISEPFTLDPRRARVYEHGWQSWSPTGAYRADLVVSPRPRRPEWQPMAFRPEAPGPATGFRSEGLLIIDPGDGPALTWVAAEPTRQAPAFLVERDAADPGRYHVLADGPVVALPAVAGLDGALGALGTHLVRQLELEAPRPLGPGWCSWYTYWGEVTEADIVENLEAMDRLDLDVRIVQVDDGHQAEIGDWLEPSGRIPSMPALAARIRQAGREAGIWTAPFLVGARSRLARDHPDWLVRGAIAAPHHWGQPIHVLDVSHPDAAEHLAGVYRTLWAWGYTYHKLDFLYGGAMVGGRHADIDPIAAYRRGLGIIREAIGPDGTILGCGAPILPSIGLVDAMRVSPDVDVTREPLDGDLSQPSQRAALATGRARAWMHDRLWVNDPDCLVVREEVESRDTWAEHVETYGALATSGDPLARLDDHGLALTRRILRPSLPGPIGWLPDAGPDGGRIVRGVEAKP